MLYGLKMMTPDGLDEKAALMELMAAAWLEELGTALPLLSPLDGHPVSVTMRVWDLLAKTDLSVAMVEVMKLPAFWAEVELSKNGWQLTAQ